MKGKKTLSVEWGNANNKMINLKILLREIHVFLVDLLRCHLVRHWRNWSQVWIKNLKHCHVKLVL